MEAAETLRAFAAVLAPDLATVLATFATTVLRAAGFGAGLAADFAAGLALVADFVAALPRAAAAGFVFLAAGFFDFFRAFEADEDLDFLDWDFSDGDLDAALAMASKRHKEGKYCPPYTTFCRTRASREARFRPNPPD